MEQSWFVKDDSQSVYGPVPHEVLNDWRSRGLIADSYYVSNDQTSWILASQYFVQIDDDYTYIERLKDLYKVFLKGSKWLVSNYLSGLQIKGEFTNPDLRSCICGHSQYSQPGKCEKCGSDTISQFPCQTITGRDELRIRLNHEFRVARGRWRSAVKYLVISLLFAFACILFTVGMRFLLFVFLFLLALSAAFIYASVLNWQIARLRKNDGPGNNYEQIYGVIDMYWRPFLQKYEGQNLTDQNLVIYRKRAPLQTAQVTYPMAEVMRLVNMLQSKNVLFFNDRVPLPTYVQSIANYLDYEVFDQQLRSLNSKTPNILNAYTDLIPSARCPIYLPFLQAFISTGQTDVSLSHLSEKIEMMRSEDELLNFEADLRAHENFIVSMQMVDSMDPIKFEHLIGFIYESNGFEYEETPASRDQGADVIVTKAGRRLVIQVKKSKSSKIGNDAVQQVIAAKTHFNCDDSAVLCNRTYTGPAIALAKSANVSLIDRADLKAMLETFNRQPKDYGKLRSLFLDPAPNGNLGDGDSPLDWI